LNSLNKEELIYLLDLALQKDSYLKKLKVKVKEYEAILQFSGGDARKLYNTLEIVLRSENAANSKNGIVITNEKVQERLQENIAIYDKNGELHYDIISAFIKSIRGGDPDAAVYWLARMLEGGEDIKFIARRLVILAAEDIGLANPNALLMANSCFQSIHVIGMPEARIILSETAIYLATSPKSNSAYMAINMALREVKDSGNLAVPLHLRNAPTKLMKEIGYGKDYKYAHSYDGNFIADQFLPDDIKKEQFYVPGKNARENDIQKNLKQAWKGKKNYDEPEK